MAKRFYPVTDLNVRNSGGTWTYTLAANLMSFDKTAADDTTTLVFAVPRDALGPQKLSDQGAVALDLDNTIKNIALNYSVATAALDAAPTVTVNRTSIDATTRAVTRAAVTKTLTFAGTNAVGTAVGTYTAEIAFATPFVTLAANESLVVEVVFNAALTTVLKTFGAELETTR